MSKNKFYFSHDGGARNDDKIIAVRMKHKAEGYAVYFMILEKLLESTNYMSVKDYNVLAFDFRVSSNVVKSVIEDFGLFEFTEDGKYFYSKGFTERMEPLESMKNTKSINGLKGNLVRYGHLTKEEIAKMSNDQILEFEINRKKSPNSRKTVAEREICEPFFSHNIIDNNIYNNTTNVDIINICENENFEFSDNSEVNNSEKEKRKKVAPKKEKGFTKEAFRNTLLEFGAIESHIEDWFKVRISKRAQFTETALQAFLNECNKNNFPVSDAVRICAERSWQGFKYQWIINENQRNATGQLPQQPFASSTKEPYFFDRERAMQALTGQTAGGLSEN